MKFHIQQVKQCIRFYSDKSKDYVSDMVNKRITSIRKSLFLKHKNGHFCEVLWHDINAECSAYDQFVSILKPALIHAQALEICIPETKRQNTQCFTSSDWSKFKKCTTNFSLVRKRQTDMLLTYNFGVHRTENLIF